MKKTIHYKELKGEFLKPCPGTRNYICCGYWVLHIAEGCPFMCNYCILRSYYEHNSIVIFSNIEQGISNIVKVLDENRSKIFRIGTGEFTDSLALPEMCIWNERLIPVMAKRSNALLELKTKSTNIERILRLQERSNLVISWSVNSFQTWEREERGTPSIQKRIEAAKRCQEEGFVIGLHFDPIFEYKGWREDYKRVIELMADRLDPKQIIWISLGTIRFMPDLLETIRENRQKSLVLQGEYVVGRDGKMRLFKPIRIEIYSFFKEHLSKWYPELGVYLCMESKEVWEMSMGWAPSDSEGLSNFLDQRKILFFGGP